MSDGGSRVIDERDKAFPASAIGLSIEGFLGTAPSIAGFGTPILVLDAAGLDNNLQVMANWVAGRGFELMPHGKTTMAPKLWHRQLRLGATGITVATPWQARVALAVGVRAVMLANECVDPGGLAGVVAALNAHPEQSFCCWADSVEAVDRLDAMLAKATPRAPLGVLVELGVPGGRTGARTIPAAVHVAERIKASPHLNLRGVAGYEGAVGHERSPESLDRIRRYLDDLRGLFQQVRGLVGDAKPIISAGGSAFFDVVGEELRPLADGSARVVLRSGAYVSHDAGFYESISPLGATRHPDGPHLTAAIWGLARVLSRPEPGLALLDGGKRDFPFDEGLPVAVAASDELGASEHPVAGRVVAMNDQHSFLQVDGDVPPVGAVIRLGLSHPCTAFDKWRLIPVIGPDGGVVDVIETFF